MNFALLNGNDVENIIVAESMDIVQALFPENVVIEITYETGPAFIGSDFIEGKFRPDKPFPSWVWNDSKWNYEAPIPLPPDGKPYWWIEETLKWELVPPPYPSWHWDDNTKQYVAPIPYPEDGKFYIWDEEIQNWVLPR